MTAGRTLCFGDSYFGQLGNYKRNNTDQYVEVFGLGTSVAGVSSSWGASHSCAVLTSGEVRCWGNGTYGQMGNGTSGQFNVYVLLR